MDLLLCNLCNLLTFIFSQQKTQIFTKDLDECFRHRFRYRFRYRYRYRCRIRDRFRFRFLLVAHPGARTWCHALPWWALCCSLSSRTAAASKQKYLDYDMCSRRWSRTTERPCRARDG